MNSYESDFYEFRHERTSYSAKRILSIVLDVVPTPTSAVDVGCGVGTWLSALRQKGVSQILGIDGDWVDPALLEIPEDSFRSCNLSETININRKFDLAISVEVGEHLPYKRAYSFVADLTRLSDVILFSAAIPMQGGRNHVNEQWQDYWASLFTAQGYVVHDFIRPRIWKDARIPSWYRQNILLFVEEGFSLFSNGVGDTGRLPLRLVHPDLYSAKIRRQRSVRGSWHLLRKAMVRYFKKRFS